MKKIIFILSLFPLISFTQSKKLIFQYEVQKDFLTSDYDLVINDDISIWKETSNPKQTGKSFSTFIASKDYKKKSLYKNHPQKYTLGDYSVLGNVFYIKDSLHHQKWELIDESEKFLGYQCKKAKTSFRGRTYEALYAPDLLISNGPWKFGGLPGMILKIIAKENGKTYRMECVSINTYSNQNNKDEFDDYLKSRKRKKFLTWDEFVLDFDSFLERHIKNLRSELEAEEDSGFSVKVSVNNHLEIFSEKAQKEGIFLEF